jgi:hypothetical protein
VAGTHDGANQETWVEKLSPSSGCKGEHVFANLCGHLCSVTRSEAAKRPPEVEYPEGFAQCAVLVCGKMTQFGNDDVHGIVGRRNEKLTQLLETEELHLAKH